MCTWEKITENLVRTVFQCCPKSELRRDVLGKTYRSRRLRPVGGGDDYAELCYSLRSIGHGSDLNAVRTFSSAVRYIPALLKGHGAEAV